ncbi:hypothetical protein [Streptomyces flavidovirens]
MTVVPAGKVFSVVAAGAALGGNEGAVDQDDFPAPLRDLLQAPVQARSAGGEQVDHLVAPAADGGLGDVVAAGHVGQALIVAEHGQDDHRDLPRRQRPPARTYRFRGRRSRAAKWLTVLVDSGRRHW